MSTEYHPTDRPKIIVFETSINDGDFALKYIFRTFNSTSIFMFILAYNL